MSKEYITKEKPVDYAQTAARKGIRNIPSAPDAGERQASIKEIKMQPFQSSKTGTERRRL